MRVGVVGAGLAGLAAACDLAAHGHRATVFERRPWAGGKTYSFTDRETGEQVDNGQHVFMTCTTEYIAFLERLGTGRLARRQRRLRVPVLDAEGRRSDLAAASLPPPFHLGLSFLRYKHLSWSEKREVARALLALRRIGPGERDRLGSLTFADWLASQRQSPGTVERLWDFLVLPTLNCRSRETSAGAALFVLKEGFLKTSRSAALGIPATGLSSLHVEPAVSYLEARGGRFMAEAPVVRIVVERGAAAGLGLAGGDIAEFDAVVCAVPPREAAELLAASGLGQGLVGALRAFRMAPIVNVHLWYDHPITALPFAAFVGCELQWLFNRTRLGRAERATRQHVVLSLSGAEAFMELTKAQVLDRLLSQLARALPEARGTAPVRTAVIKEPEATFVPAPGLARPGPRTEVANLFLAGAYTDTGWPATMESAVRSGMAASAAVRAHEPAIAARVAASDGGRD